MENKKRITIKTWLNSLGRDIFSYSCENNTVKKTIEAAVRQNILDFAFADLTGFNLSGIDLRNVDLSYAKLNHTILCYANLSGADLNHADLSDAILSDANLLGADLYGADLSGADLSDAKIDYPMDIPDGEFIGWKKVNGNYIIKLKILEDSKRSRATSNKCRCDKALVLEIQNLDGSKSDLVKVVNTEYKRCVYQTGKIVKADSWDEDKFNECSHGIHFFLDREKALKY